jgi:hypothetical protein
MALIVYSSELHPSKWTKDSMDHPWIVEASRRYQKTISTQGLRAGLQICWELGAVIARATAEQLRVPIDINASPIKWIEQCRLVVETRREAFPNGGQAGSPRSQLDRLIETMPWLEKLLSSQNVEEDLEKAPFNYRDHIYFIVINAAIDLVGAMRPVTSRPTPQVSTDWMSVLQQRILDGLQKTNVDVFMRDVIDTAERVITGDWSPFRSLSFDQEMAEHREWVVRVVEAEPPDEPLEALWFGLANPIRDGLATTDLYFGGVFSRDDADWMGDLSYQPKAGDLHSEVLARIYDVAYREGDLGNCAEFPLCLAYGLWVARESGSTYAKRVDREIWIAAGFDSGDVLISARSDQRPLPPADPRSSTTVLLGALSVSGGASP